MSEATALASTAAPAPEPPRLEVVSSSAARRPPTPTLDVPPYDLEAALRLQRTLGVSHTLAQVLVRRGLSDPQTAAEFLDPRDAHDPTAFEGIDRAVEAIASHLRARKRIVVHGDYDVDGVCATAVMVRALRALGGDVRWFLPSRFEDGYGLSEATVRRLAAAGTGLLITVDCGITSVAEVDLARSLGLDVVVSDHHMPRADGQLPDCAVVHPGVCGYPCTELCGTGVAFKLADALEAPTVADDIELVALATVADVVLLRGENRRLVREGLAAMGRSAKPGLRALMQVAGVDPSSLDAKALGFRLGPRLNAAGRLRRADAGLELLLTEDRERASEIARELDAINVERQAVEQRISWEAEAQIAELGERSAYVLAGEEWHAGVVGIVASRVVERHHRPAVLIALGDDGIGQGSGRSIPGFDLLGALHACAGHMVRYGGHPAAAGLTIAAERVSELRADFERFAEEALTPELLTPLERVDAIVSGSELGLGLADELARLEPCGMGNPRPRLLIPGSRFDDIRPMGDGRHARFSVSSAGARARAVAFGCDGWVTDAPGEPHDATFRLERNVFNGAVEPRLLLSHARPSSQGSIELLGEPESYLAGAWEEVDREEVVGPRGRAGSARRGSRTMLDRRGESPLAVLADARTAGGGVLALCADVARRLPGLRDRSGGYALSCYHALESGAVPSGTFAHVVLLDPPSAPEIGRLLMAEEGFIHLAWNAAELRFAKQMHELEFGLRTSLVALYRSLRAKGRVIGEELEQLLRGDGPHARSPHLAGRLIRVLAELELVSLNRDLPALEIGAHVPTALERSPTYRACATRYEDGLRFLSSENLRLTA